MKHTKKRVAALLLTLAMVLSLMPAAFAADTDFPDMPAEDDPSYAAVKSAVDNEIMTGENGQLNLEGTILRSTVSKMVVTAFAAKGEADLSSFGDVNSDAWYAQWMAKANQMGIMTGTSGMMRPGDEVTLQEVAAMLVRALGLEPGSEDDLKDVPGAEDVAPWAVPYVAALVNAKYISDVTGANQPMTRGAFAEVIYKVSGEGNYVNEGEITEDVDGNIVITADGVSLKGITVKGDVIIADGVDAGSISLDGVTIEGRLVVRGGSSVELTNSTASATVIAKTFDEVTVKADNASDTGDIAVAGTNGKAADKVTLDMAEPNAVISTDTSVAIQNATGGTVSMESANVSVTVESGTLDNVVVSDGMESAKIEVAEGATIDKVTTNTDVTIAGEGTVNEKEGTGTVTDAEGNEVAGSDEPANVPDISDAPFTSEEDTTAPSGSVAHTHNYDRENPTTYDATNHVIVCVTDEEDATIVGCGAQVFEPHVYNVACKPDGEISNTAEENTAKMCACGKVQPGTVTDVGEPVAGEGENAYNCPDGTEHNWKLKTTTAATCKAEGTKVWECTNKNKDGKQCSTTRTDKVEKLAHTPVVKATTDATCTTDGEITYKCSVADCGEDLTNLTVKVSKETVAHTFDEEPVVVPATCQVAGTRTWTCSVEGCGGTHVDSIPVSPNAHTFGKWTDNGDGTHSRTCDNAKAAATAAEDNEGGDAPAANTCGFKETRAHNWVSNKDAVAATCTKDGKTDSYKCADNCGVANKVAETIKATGVHSFGSAWESDSDKHWHECANEGCTVKSGEADHTWSKVEQNDKGEFVKAEGAYCTVCGEGKDEGGSTGPSTHTHSFANLDGKCTVSGCNEICSNQTNHAGLHKDNTCSNANCSYAGTVDHSYVNGAACSCGKGTPGNHSWDKEGDHSCKATGHTQCVCTHTGLTDGKGTCSTCGATVGA